MQLVTTYDTVLCADSVEWCPIAPFQRLFVCGNYQLEEDKSNGTSDAPRARYGQILLFEYQTELHCLQTVKCAAVLDQKWCHNLLNDCPVLAVATGHATLNIYKLQESKLHLWLSYTYSHSTEEDRMFLSVDWSTGKYHSKEPQLVVSDNLGMLHLFHLKEDGLKLINSWKLHSYEAWIGAFDYWNTKCLFSGADDSIFIQINTETAQQQKNTSHNCGVTSMHSNAGREYTFATGSYDEFVHIWDTRMLKAPRDSAKMPGPVWRVKWHPVNHNRLITACMAEGVSIVEFEETKPIRFLSNFKEHNDIAYGVDRKSVV